MVTHDILTTNALSKNRQLILAARLVGNLTGKEFRWYEASVPQPSEQVLVRNLWLSVDPAQRLWMWRDSYIPKIPIGEVMASFAVGQVLESRHPDFKAGDIVRGSFGWQDYVATDGKVFGGMHKVSPGVSPNLVLSLFGINGLTAYFGITKVGQVKAGETVVVSGAAGATGSVAGQIAKIKGCRVIGTAGSKEKCDWLVGEAHFDAAIDYKSEDLRARNFRRLSQWDQRLLRQRWRRRPQRGTGTHQPEGADRPLRFDLDLRRLRATARPGELSQPCSEARAHRGIQRD
jgi:NADPH-dependent curcumin reductase CurA